MQAKPKNQLSDNERDPGNLSPVLRKAVWISISIVFVLSLVDLAAWITGINLLKSIAPNWESMRVSTSFYFLFTALALVVIFTKRTTSIKAGVPVITGIFLITVSLLTVFSWLYSEVTGIESTLTTFPVLNLVLTMESRMDLLSAVIFLLFGIILILLTSDNRVASNTAHTLCFVSAIGSYMVPASYLLNVLSVHQFFETAVALNSGIAFCAVCIAIFMMRPDTWLMGVFTSKNSGGIMARRLFPWLILLPVVIGWLRIYGEHAGLFISETGVFLVALTYTFCFILLVWFAARSVNRIDRRRQAADKALKKSYEDLEGKVRERTSELLNLNKALDIEITERKKAEELVESERQRINGLLELMPAYMILLNPDYHVAYSNRFFRERFGVSNGKRCFEFLFNRSEPCEICETYKVLKENKPLTWEWTGPDGHNYSIFDFPYSDSDGSPLIMEMGIDVTDLKKAEERLVTLNAELEQRVKERTRELVITNERLDILSQTSSRLLASDNPQALINSLCDRVMKFLDCQVFFNFLVDESKGKLHLHSYAGIPAEVADGIEWLDFGTSVCGCVACEGSRIVAENTFETPDARTDLVKSFGIQAYACHPMLSHEKVIGTLLFGTSSRTSFSDDDLSMMKTVTDQVAIAMTRVRNEESIRRSEERYRSLMELSPEASFVSRNNSIVMLNTAAQKLLGINSAEEIIGKSPLDVFHPRCYDRIKSRIDSILKGDSVPMAEEQIIRADGAVRDVEVVSAEIVDSEGPAIQVIMNDITERKLAEKELFDTKNYLQNLIDYANAPIIVWDQENKIRLFNRAFEHLTGYSSSEVEGKNLGLLFPEATLNESMEKIKSALTKNWETIDIPILTKNNEIRIVLWNSAKVQNKSRKTFSTIAQGNDITERLKAEKAFKESREKLELALENGSIGTWEWEIGTGKLIWDERMERMFGQNPGKYKYTYEEFEKLVHEEDIAHVRESFEIALGEDKPLDTVYRIKIGNDGVRYISAKGLVEKNGKEIPVKMTGVCYDITEMKKGAEKALFALNENLLRSNRELEQFAYVASHDLQEPLRMVSSFTQLLAQRYKDKLDQDAQEFIQYAVDGASRMQILINDLLDYSRIETRGKKFLIVDMHDVLEQVVNNLSLMIQEKNALVTNGELPRVVADQGQMIQLMQNLVMNSLKFCHGSPRVHISAREEQDQYLFSVKDNGIGIESQYFSKIFQIFQRLHPREEYGGTGMGLAICKRIVDRHGGKIWVESQPGSGSVFYFTIMKR